jgi:hypothetical protein
VLPAFDRAVGDDPSRRATPTCLLSPTEQGLVRESRSPCGARQPSKSTPLAKVDGTEGAVRQPPF